MDLTSATLTLPSTRIELDAYFQRIGLGNIGASLLGEDCRPTLETLRLIHRQHPIAIPFENLNPLLKQPVSLSLPSLQQKLIHQGRGGYCFEHNLLLRSVLLALGFQVKGLAARVRWNLPEEAQMPRTHMVLLTDIDGEPYIADVGFGGLGLTAPLHLAPNVEQETTHEPFRFIQQDDLYTMQVKLDQTWKSLYSFDLQEQQLPDYEVANWYVSTHPDSLFVNHLVVARPDEGCRYALRNNELSIHHLNGQTNGQTEKHRIQTIEELVTVLQDLFLITLPENDVLESVLDQIVKRA
ncbi:arylamine N-acetyltransferase family protein [Leptolyngbya ohadii]|uniref:arylamine N-acetyltransferase family protein n=1 Tax=Leptolyngbya ohadii TaxID=1962290 RepID=UPI000B59BAF7|nr:arylamine N-acetyltransferase [Leptolyngbya ohadii]